MQVSPLHSLAERPATANVLLAAALLFALATGVFGLGRSGESHDVFYLYNAGMVWRQGGSPYELDRFVHTAEQTLGAERAAQFRHARGFAYPPHSILPAVGLSLLPVRFVPGVVLATNLLLLVTLAVGSARLVERATASGPIDPVRLACIFTLASPFVSHVLFMGQTSLIAAAALTWAWLMAGQGNRLAAGVLLAVASIKPQMAALPILFVVAAGQGRILLAGAFAGLAMLLPAVAISGPGPALVGWISALGDYAGGPYQGFQHDAVFGLAAVLDQVGAPRWISPIAGVLALIALRLQLGPRFDLASLGILVGLNGVTLYGHDYDLAGLTPLLLFLWIQSRGRPIAALAFAGATLLLFVPKQALRPLDLGIWMRLREVMLLVDVVLAVALRPVPRSAPPAEAAARTDVAVTPPAPLAR